jgi:small-conductance mechanosensitive channel/CRP-like cAMP-binding protein
VDAVIVDSLKDLNGSLLLTALFAAAVYIGSVMAINVLAKKSALLKPVGAGLKLLALFAALRIFLQIGPAEELHPQLYRQLSFFSWLIFTVGALRLILYIYGDLFVVRWKHGSFPAAFKKILGVVVVVVTALVLMKEILNINVTSLIATTTVLTATIGLAFQSTLANMLAGLTIHLEKPLRQGDWVSAAGHEGRVLDITLRSVRIVTLDHNEVFIPNSKVLSEAVVNYSLPETVQIRKASVSAAYSAAPNRVKRASLDALAAVPGVAAKPEPLVRVSGYGESAVHYEIRYAIDDHSRSIEIDAELMQLLWYRFNRSGIEMPTPVRSVYLHQITSETCRMDAEQRGREIAVMMQKVEILTPLTDAERVQLASEGRSEHYATGEFPVRKGEAGDSFYLIRSGRVDVLVQKSGSEPSVIATLGPGNFFGEMSLLTGEVRTADIRVKEDAEFIVIDKEIFASTLTRNPSIAESLSRILAERQADLSDRERLDAASREQRRNDASRKVLSRIREFFGLAQ